MGIDIALIVAAGNAALELRLLQMAARPIDTVLGDGRDGAVRRPGCRLGRADLDDAADAGVLQPLGRDAGDVVRPPVDSIHYYGQVFAQLVGQVLVHDPADNGRLGRSV